MFTYSHSKSVNAEVFQPYGYKIGFFTLTLGCCFICSTVKAGGGAFLCMVRAVWHHNARRILIEMTVTGPTWNSNIKALNRKPIFQPNLMFSMFKLRGCNIMQPSAWEPRFLGSVLALWMRMAGVLSILVLGLVTNHFVGGGILQFAPRTYPS